MLALGFFENQVWGAVTQSLERRIIQELQHDFLDT
jgi:hypothetical protein